MTLAQLLDEWLAWRESNGKPISPATRHGYRLTVETKIKPVLGYLPVAKVDARVLDRFYAALRKAGNVRTGCGKLSASRIRDVHAILSGALGLGARWGYVPFNAALLARPPAPRNAARRLPTAEQARVLMAAAARRDPEFELFVRLGAATGLRRGEVVALRWCDLDLDGAELSVSGNVLFVRGLAGGFVRKGPKSEHGERLVALDARTVELLRSHRVRRAERALAVGASLAEDSYLFTRVPDGARPIRPEAMTRRFSRLAASLGHGYTLHGLRYFTATQLGAVAEAATVRERMGHGSLTVSSIYTHQVSAADRAAAEHCWAASPCSACSTTPQPRPPTTTRRRSAGSRASASVPARPTPPWSPPAARCGGGGAMTATIWRTCPSCGAGFGQPDDPGRKRRRRPGAHSAHHRRLVAQGRRHQLPP